MAEETPSYQNKKFVDPDQEAINAANWIAQNVGNKWIGGQSVGSNVLANSSPQAKYLISKGLGGYTATDLQGLLKDLNFVTSTGVGKAISYEDLAREALSGDPTFDPNDESAITRFAQDLEKRGLTNKDREKISTLATTSGVQNAIDKATNPGKYLSEEQRAANLETANRLLAQNYGADFSDPDLAEFLTERLAEGESAFEISQFLQTTPQFLEKKAKADREAINQELLASEDEVFKRATPQIISSYMRAGRLGSSGLDSALAKARTELASQRQGMLTGYAREDVVGARNAAFQNYLRQSEPGYQQRFNVQNASNFNTFQQPYNNLARQYSLNDQATARRYQLEDYNMQRSDFDRYLEQSRRGGGQAALYGLLGNLAGNAGTLGLGKLFGAF